MLVILQLLDGLGKAPLQVRHGMASLMSHQRLQAIECIEIRHGDQVRKERKVLLADQDFLGADVIDPEQGDAQHFSQGFELLLLQLDQVQLALQVAGEGRGHGGPIRHPERDASQVDLGLLLQHRADLFRGLIEAFPIGSGLVFLLLKAGHAFAHTLLLAATCRHEGREEKQEISQESGKGHARSVTGMPPLNRAAGWPTPVAAPPRHDPQAPRWAD